MPSANRIRPIQLVVPAALLLAAACGRGEPGGRPEHPERLGGTWTVEFRLEHSATLTRDPAGVPTVRGTVVLVENDRARRIAGVSGVPTHYGVYAADLRPLDLPGTGPVPTLVARLAPGDTVEIGFDPELGRPFVGRGTLAGDSVAGHWWTQPGGRTVGRSSGRFIMRRP